MTDEIDIGKEVDQFTARLCISAKADITPPEELQLYGAGVKFFAYWLTKQDGVLGMDTPALFDELKQNICKAMAAGTQGTG